MKYRTRWVFFVVLACIALLLPSVARGDGMVFAGRDLSALSFMTPNEQVAAIAHRSGRQKMIIVLNFNAEDQDNALWIFPVPGKPSQVKVDVVDSFPRFRGTDPRTRAVRTLHKVMIAARATQFWPFFLDSLAYLTRGGMGADVAIHGEVEKWGIHAETITAKSVSDLTEYLRTKKAGVVAERLTSFQPYLSDGYVLVLVWIASQEQVKKEFPSDFAFQQPGVGRQPALYVEFPTEQAYYPMRPTSAYGETEIRVRLYVVGYVKPRPSDVFENENPRVHFYERDGLPQNTPAAFGADLASGPFEYTAISLQAPARTFTSDLGFSPTAPLGIGIAHGIEWFGNALWLFLPLIVAPLSYLSAGIAGLLAGRHWRNSARLGFWNLLTFIGFWVAVSRVHRQEDEAFRKSRLLFAFAIIFPFLTVALEIVLLSLMPVPESLAGLGMSAFLGMYSLLGVFGVLFLLAKGLNFLGKAIFRQT